MKRSSMMLVIAYCAFHAVAEAQEAKVRSSLGTSGDLWVGQRIVIVVELMAPGFFASAAAFDLPDPKGILLIPPSGSPALSSETVGGVSYTVQRHELSVIAQRAGPQTIPPLTIRFEFKRAPLDKETAGASVKTEPLQFTAKLPLGAEKLGSVISARDLKVVENWKPEPGRAKVGDAFTRTIIYSASDVPAMAFPPFPAGKVDGIGIYPKAPEVLDHSNRGQLQGERHDVSTYVCERAGTFVIPAARMTWWNLESKSLQTIELPAKVIQVSENPALAQAERDTTNPVRQAMSLDVVLLWLAGFGSVLGWLFYRFGAQWLRRFRPVHLVPLNPDSDSRH